MTEKKRFCNYPKCDCLSTCQVPDEKTSWYRNERESANPPTQPLQGTERASPPHEGVKQSVQYDPHPLVCNDPSCTICAWFGTDDDIAENHVARRAIVQEIRQLREFVGEHPEHAVEAYCRINELLDQLGDDK